MFDDDYFENVLLFLSLFLFLFSYFIKIAINEFHVTDLFLSLQTLKIKGQGKVKPFRTDIVIL